MSMTSGIGTAPAGTAELLNHLTGKWISQAISVAAELRIADHVADGPKTVIQLAELTECHAASLHRLLRALASVGVFAESQDGQFENTTASAALRSDIEHSMRPMARFFGDHPTWSAWGELCHSIRTGQAAFDKVHGSKFFEYLSEHPEVAEYFNDSMTTFTAREIELIPQVVDFSGIRTLVDVGGGHGIMLCSILKANPQQQGILFDQPHVLSGAEAIIAAAGVASRCELVSGNFFEYIPEGADGYLLKRVLHNWSDDDALKILKTLRRAMRASGRLFVIDPAIREGNDASFTKLLDLEIMVLYQGGRERTERQFNRLFQASGFEVVRWIDPGCASCVLEARPI